MQKRRICVTDANIWIDVRHGRLLETIFALPYEWVAPDLVVAELEDPPGATLVALGLQQMELTGTELAQVSALAARYRKPSTVDLSALVLSMRLRVTLVTGDGALRIAAQEQGVDVHGTLWLLDLMVDTHGAITAAAAADGLEAMVAADRRLPAGEVQQRLARWRKE